MSYIVGKGLYNAACKALMKAIVELGAGNRTEALKRIEEAITAARSWSNAIEEEITRKHLEEHAHADVHRGG